MIKEITIKMCDINIYILNGLILMWNDKMCLNMRGEKKLFKLIEKLTHQ
jgi:hypothetical protein